jgi:hypothetical protein
MIDTVHLNFNLNEDVTHVTSRLALKPNYKANGSRPALTLNGRPDVKLVEVKLAGRLILVWRGGMAIVGKCSRCNSSMRSWWR